MSALEEFLEDELAPEGAPSEEDLYQTHPGGKIVPTDTHPWEVEDESAADWAGRKAQRARRLIAEKRAEHERIVAKADAWLERETSRLESEAAFFEGKLGDWLAREIAKDPKGKKSRDLPCGVTVKRTGGSPSLVVDDEDALLQWLKDFRPDLVDSKIVWEWSKADVKKLRQDDDRLALVDEVVDESTGEVVREVAEVKGARIERGPYSFKVVVDGGA